LDAGSQDRGLFITRESCTFSEGAERDDTGAALLQEPATVLSKELVINIALLTLLRVFDFSCRHGLDPGRKDWRTNRLMMPVKQEFSYWATDASLAWAHAAAREQLRGTPIGFTPQARKGNIFAAADNGVICAELAQLRPERKGAFKCGCEGTMSLTFGREPPGFRFIVRSSEPRNLAFAKRSVEATNAGWLSSAVDILDGRLL
jgi:hypothetical protein